MARELRAAPQATHAVKATLLKGFAPLILEDLRRSMVQNLYCQCWLALSHTKLFKDRVDFKDFIM